MAADIWPVVHAERRSLSDDLHSLSDEGWESPSLCPNWTVRDTVAHMAATAKTTPAGFFPSFIGAGFKFENLQAKNIARERGATAAETLQHFDAVLTSTKRPPGPPATMLGETIVHADDIRRPLGLAHQYPSDALVTIADFYKGSNLLIGTKRRIDGVSLRATDAEWSHGAGPEVTGPMLSLVLAMTGRPAALDDLNGAGVDVLRARA